MGPPVEQIMAEVEEQLLNMDEEVNEELEHMDDEFEFSSTSSQWSRMWGVGLLG